MTDTLAQFRTLLTDRLGWRLDNDRGELARLLTARGGSGDTARAYVEALATSPPDSPELQTIAETLAVSETYFFRNPEQFAALADVVLPAALERVRGSLRILSAGAASGEEAYSVAMTLLQHRKHHRLPRVEIVGVDVSRRAIERARRGEYSPWALRALPPPLLSEFFVRSDRHFRIRPDVASMVRFEEGNLLSLARLAPGPWDIVFFRNTFMYFTADIARQVFAQVAAAMPPESFLFLGHAETLRGVSDAFALRHSHGTFYYQRQPAGAEAMAADSTRPITPHRAPPDSGVPGDTAWFDDIQRASARIASLVDGRPDPAPNDRRTLVPAPQPAPLQAALALLAQERHDAALAALGHGTDPERRLLRAVLLVNMGRPGDARIEADALLTAPGMQASAHYILALSAERSGDDAQAFRHDEMAIHFDDTFAMPHLHLALVARRRGNRAGARQHALRARVLFAAEDDLRILIFGGGFGRQGLLQLCDAQIDSRAS
jgi:chemotaxis protein methyltransferase CheR